MALPTLGKYQIVREIGRGGMGAVYEAVDPVLDRHVAIKTIRLSEAEDASYVRERFAREARTTSRLSHPNIVSIYDFGEADGLVYMVMEYLAGKDLGILMNESAPASWPGLIPFLLPCAEALDYAHQYGIVHLDIKPANIVVTDKGPVKILDFGLARLAFHNKNTQEGLVTGTVSYLAPESVQGMPTSPGTDQFALAILVYRLLTGTFPFKGETTYEMLFNIVGSVQIPVAKLNTRVPRSASEAIDRALSKDPALRFSKCVEFLSEILPYLPVIAQPDPVPAARPSDFTQMFSARGRQTPPVRPEPPRPPMPPPPPPAVLPRIAVTKPSGFLESLKGLFSFGPKKGEPGTPDQSPVASEITVMVQSPRGPQLAPKVLAARQADELIQMGRSQRFAEVVAMNGQWLSGGDSAEPALLAFREAARYLLAAQNANSYSAVDHLVRAETLLATAGNQIRESRTPLAVELSRTLKIWTQIAATGLSSAREKAALQLPNPFRAGQPLRPNQGESLFRGRGSVVRQIESILTEANQSGSIALLGPRRCGKTSLLQMLPTLIPDALCVFFDLQDNPVESPQAFFAALYRQAREQARRDRQIDIPELKAGSFSAAMEWLQALDTMPGNLRILLCIDEFERLEDLFPGDHQDVLRLMGLFRATIQHRTRLRLMVSGVAPFDELGQMWNDHFINVRQIRVGHLDRETAIDLLVHPVPGFPEEAIGRTVAESIYARTGGQPYLTQLYGSLLISQLNLAGSRKATADDVEPVESEARAQGAHYLRHCYEAAPAPARLVLQELACARKPPFDAGIQRWLASRGLVDDRGNLAIPVLGSFMKEELGLQ